MFVAAFARRLQIGHLNVIFITIAMNVIFIATIATTILIFTIANVVGIVTPPIPTPILTLILFRRIFVFYLFFEKA